MSRPFPSFRTGAALLLATSLLVACDENGDFVAMQAFEPKNADVSDAAEPTATSRTGAGDVEAPEVFSASEAGLWDGRPSLGGVWVAHPDVNEPERVIIRNSGNDKFVVGALFRREREIPGPRLQISSDAAEALGILAGAPTDLTVTALRKEEVADTPETDGPTGVASGAAPEAVAASSLDPMTVETAALDAPAPQTPSGLTPEPFPAVATNAPAPSQLSKPFIQIGIFSVEANADRTAKQMRSGGIPPTVKRFERDGKPFWRVLAGPAATAAEHRQLLTKVKGEGFTDAYAVTN